MARPKHKKDVIITDDLRELINTVASETAKETANRMIPAQQVSYYKVTERLLYNYKPIKRMMEDEQAYIENADKAERSQDIVLHSIKMTSGPRVDAEDAMLQQRRRSYERTLAQFEYIDRVIRQFADKPEFVVIRMYYFNETVDGQERPAYLERYTWDEIADILDEHDILSTDKTARRWRSSIVSDMAVCFFGADAAVSEGVRYALGNENHQNMTVS